MNIDLVLKRLELIKESKGINTISDTEASIILNEIERLKKRIDKAIESVQEHYDHSYLTDEANDIGCGTYDDLMEILKGDDKE